MIDLFLDTLENKGKRTLTVKTYGYILRAFSHWLTETGGDITNLTRFDVQSYIRYLEQDGKSATTINKIFACLSAFARFLKRSDLMEEIQKPAVLIPQHISPKSLVRKERNRLLRDVERDGNLRNIAITYTLLFTGIRVSELCGLNREDVEIHPRSGRLIIRNGKGRKERSVPLSVELRLHLRRYMDSRKDQDPALFLSNFKKRISVRATQYVLAKYHVHPHELRHTFCRELVGAGIDLTTVADLAGHADINVTRRYTMPSEEELQKVIDKVFMT
jgi:integrase/recombinase XerD